MSSNSPTTVPKRRPRRVAKKDSFERIAAQVIASDPKSFLAKNPTRAVPDLPGFSMLSKTEVKKDTTLMEKKISPFVFAGRDEEDSEADIEHICTRPNVLPESTLIRKKDRLLEWHTNPTLIDTELQKYRDAVNSASQRYDGLFKEQKRWEETFERARRLLHESQFNLIAKNQRLRKDSDKLFSLIEAEFQQASSKKRRVVHMRDIIEQLHERQLSVLNSCSDFDDRLHNLFDSEFIPQLAVEQKRSGVTLRFEWPTELLIDEKGCENFTAKKSSKLTNLASKRMLQVVEAIRRDACDNSSTDRIDLSEFVYPFKPEKGFDGVADPAADYDQHVIDECKPELTKFTGLPSTCTTEEATNSEGSRSKDAEDDKLDTNLHMEISAESAVEMEKVGDFGNGKSIISKNGESRKLLPDEGKRWFNAKYSSELQDLNNELQTMWSTIEESVNLSENSLDDLLTFFQERDNEKDRHILDIFSDTEDHGKVTGSARKDHDFSHSDSSFCSFKQLEFAERLKNLTEDSQWAECIDKVLEGHTSMGSSVGVRKKRKVQECVNLSTSLRSNFDRGALLLYSPLSQFADRSFALFGNHISDGRVDGSGDVDLPSDIVSVENDVLESCRIRSCTAAADLKIRRLKAAETDLHKKLHDSLVSLRKSEALLNSAKSDALVEQHSIKKELVIHGVIQGDANGSLSPISEAVETLVPKVGTKGASKSSKKVLNGRNGSAINEYPVNLVQTSQQLLAYLGFVKGNTGSVQNVESVTSGCITADSLSKAVVKMESQNCVAISPSIEDIVAPPEVPTVGSRRKSSSGIPATATDSKRSRTTNGKGQTSKA